MLVTAMPLAAPAIAQPQPMDLATQQAQTRAQLNQQSAQTQRNNLQLEQNMRQDRIREQKLFRRPPFVAPPARPRQLSLPARPKSG